MGKPLSTRNGACPLPDESKFDELVLFIYQMARTSKLEDFKSRVFTRLQDFFSINAGLWITRSQQAGVTEHAHPSAVYTHNCPRQMIEDFVSTYIHQGIAMPIAMENPGVTYDFRDIVSDEEWEQTDMWKNFHVPYKVARQTVTCMLDEDAQMLNIFYFFREDRDHLFTREECQLQQRLAPHLVEALRLNFFIHLLNKQRSSQKTGWQCICDTEGHIFEIDAGFGQWLEQQFPQWNRGTLPFFPVSLELDEATLELKGGQLHYQKMDDIMLFTLLPQRDISALTTREQEVYKLIIDGKSAKEISRVLDISVRTAELHCSNIYKKLNVRGAKQLISQFSR